MIKRLRRLNRLSAKGFIGIGDDCAALPNRRGHYILLTADMLMEGVHFTNSIKPFAIGHKALGCGLSDIAAMGGKPKAVVVSLGLKGKEKVSFVEEIYRGMRVLAKRFAVDIVGGDIIKSKKVVINVTVFGEVERKNCIQRNGARPGEFIFVTGPLGNAIRLGKHYRFLPRVKESRWMVTHHRPTAMIDITDGFMADLQHILEESGVGAVLYEDLIPLSKGATLSSALYEGEDFELLFTLSPKETKKLFAQKPPFPLWCIGQIIKRKDKKIFIDKKGKLFPVAPKGFTHF